MHSSATIAKLAPALTKAAALLSNPIATETAKMGTFSYRFAPLDDLATNVRATLADCDLVMVQEATSTNDGRVGVTTRIVHTSGEWIEMGPLHMPAGDGAQGHGSALTYARRYAILAALVLAAEDDDGAKASTKTPRGGGVRAPAYPPRGAPVKDVAVEERTAEPPSPAPPPSAAANVSGGGNAAKTDGEDGGTAATLAPDSQDGHKFKGDPDGACLICGWFLDAHSAKAKA